METSRPRSFFEDLKLREVNGFRLRKRPYMGNNSKDLDPIGAVAIEHRGEPSPPMALSFCKTSKNSHILALTDEGGYITLFDTRKRFMDSYSYQENAEKAKVSEWVGHNNAIFDLSWNKDDANILTASGDQSIKVWDAQEKKCIRALRWHVGSVKSISCHPTNQDLVVPDSRDGAMALWDIRCFENTQQQLQTWEVYHYVDELTTKIKLGLEIELEAKVNKKVQENLTWVLKKLGDANPDLKLDIGEFCATVSSEDDNGTPMTKGAPTS
ncbi:hypothetical protein OROGR_016808 [Orobanche gracilis]